MCRKNNAMDKSGFGARAPLKTRTENRQASNPKTPVAYRSVNCCFEGKLDPTPYTHKQGTIP